MSDSPVIYDSSKNMEYYRKFLRHSFRIALIVYFFAGGIFTFAFLGFMSSSLAKGNLWIKIISFIFLLSAIFFFFLLFPIWEYVNYKNRLKDRKVGLRVDNKGICFLPADKHWSYEEIEFVLIDELYCLEGGGLILIKTKQYKHVDITPELLKNPQKLWKKFAPKERRVNTFYRKWVDDMDRFISTLKHYGVKVYYRKRDSYVIEEVINEGKK